MVRVWRVATYARISEARAGDEHGVINQGVVTEKHCTDHDWTIVARLSDNDLSATYGARRPGYEALMAAAARREFDAIVVFQSSRLWRNRRERAEGIEILRHAGVSVIAVKGPSLDMSTAYGRGMAALLGEFDTMEVEVKAERQQLANEEFIRAGNRWVQCSPSFGYEDDHLTPHPVNGPAVDEACRMLLAGSTLSAVTRKWDELGLRPPQYPFGPMTSHPWHRNSVTTILKNPRIAGLNAMPLRDDPNDDPEHDDPPRKTRRKLPAELLPGTWEPLVSEPVWRATLALLEDPARKIPRGVTTMLGGVARCPCTTQIQASRNHMNTPTYRCAPGYRGSRPGPHVAVKLAPVNEYVIAVIVARLARPDLADLIAPAPDVDTAALHAERTTITMSLDEMAADRAVGLITRTQMLAANERAGRRLAEIGAELAGSSGASVLAPFLLGQRAEQVWEGLDLPRKRAVIGELCEITLLPAGRGAKVFNPANVQVRWHNST